MLIRSIRHSNGHGRGLDIIVDLDTDGNPRLTLEPAPLETLDDHEISRSMLASEAREVAAMLWHYADESDRRHPR